MKVALLSWGLCSAGAATADDCSTTVQPAWQDGALSVACRVNHAFNSLDGIDEKLGVLSGETLAQLNISPLVATDGPHGPTHAERAYSFPAQIALAATFDTALARRYGEAIGQEFRATGFNQMIGPTLDVVRTWRFGRTPETYGEDPTLAEQMAVPVIKGLQSQGVAAMMKHFAGYTQDQGRTGDLPFGDFPAVNMIVSDRVMREVYLRPFRAAVEEADALGVMCAFPRINGVYACEHPELYRILKEEWGFRGVVVPDFPDAQRSVIEAVNAGLDQGSFGLPMGAAPFATPAADKEKDENPEAEADGLGALFAALPSGPPGGISLREAVESGAVSQARLDDMVRRRLTVIFESGDLTKPAPIPNRAMQRAVALQVATDGAVLLKNSEQILPIRPEVKRIAVIGRQATAAATVNQQGSPFIALRELVAPVDAVKQQAGSGREVVFAEGTGETGPLPTVPGAVLTTPDGKPGLRATYVGNHNLDFSASPILVRTESGVDVTGRNLPPALPPLHRWSVRWEGQLTPQTSGLHRFTISGGGSGRLIIDGKRVAYFSRVDFGASAHASLALDAGRPVSVTIEWTPRESAPMPAIQAMGTTLGQKMHFGWAEPDGAIERAASIAAVADVAIVFAGVGFGEGADRTTLTLPDGQDALISAVAAANPNTVVVLHAGGPVAMPWLADVKAVLNLWYSGDAAGTAAAQLLLGDAVPGGRLPITFPQDESQGLGTGAADYPGTLAEQGWLDELRLSEGLNIGYRYYDAHDQTPLFPFGFGLGYTRVELARPTVEQRTDGSAVVRATLINQGKRIAKEVVQVYLRFPAESGEPEKQLAAFDRFELEPGERKNIEVMVPARAFALFDERLQQWRRPHGEVGVLVGLNSAEITEATSSGTQH